MAQWGHIRTFTPWEYIVDAAAEKLLAPTGWTRPTDRQSPTGADLVERYLVPLAEVLGLVVRTGIRVVAVSREGMDRSRSVGRDARPFVVRVEAADGTVQDLRARAVIDASGTWEQHNPLGASGLPALGEVAAHEAGFLVGPLPDVLGADRARFAGRTTLVVGMGHSAANTLVALAQLAREVPGTRIVWAIRGTSARRVFGGGTADQLPDRGQLGADLQDLVTSGALEYVSGFSTRELRIAADGQSVAAIGDTREGERSHRGGAQRGRRHRVPAGPEHPVRAAARPRPGPRGAAARSGPWSTRPSTPVGRCRRTGGASSATTASPGSSWSG